MKATHLLGLGLIGLGVVSTSSADVYGEFDDSEDDVSCQVSTWAYSECQLGQQVRTRNVIRDLRGRGMPCPTLEQTIPCQPVACAVSDWTAFSACDEYGSKVRTREVVVEPLYGGSSCPRLEDRVRCHIGDCEVCEWTNWTCNPETETQSRVRHVIVQPNELGAACPHLAEEKPCDPVDCVLNSTFVPVTDCGRVSGKQTFQLQVVQEPLYGGKVCVQQEQVRDCPVNCEVDGSDEWTECDPTTGLQTRSRRITVPALHGGEKCPPLVDEQECPVACVMSGFGEWSSCDLASRNRTRSKHMITRPLNGGDACPSVEEQQEECVVDCVVKYSDWSPCDAYTESQFRSGTIQMQAKNGGTPCPAEAVLHHEERKCSAEQVDCVCRWCTWGKCKRDGYQYRKRVVSVAPTNGGAACPAPNRRKQRRPCKGT